MEFTTAKLQLQKRNFLLPLFPQKYFSFSWEASSFYSMKILYEYYISWNLMPCRAGGGGVSHPFNQVWIPVCYFYIRRVWSMIRDFDYKCNLKLNIFVSSWYSWQWQFHQKQNQSTFSKLNLYGRRFAIDPNPIFQSYGPPENLCQHKTYFGFIMVYK